MLIKSEQIFNKQLLESLYTQIFSNKCRERPMCQKIWGEIIKQNNQKINLKKLLGEPNFESDAENNKVCAWIFDDNKIFIKWVIVATVDTDFISSDISYEIVSSNVISDSVLAKSAIELFTILGFKLEK